MGQERKGVGKPSFTWPRIRPPTMTVLQCECPALTLQPVLCCFKCPMLAHDSVSAQLRLLCFRSVAVCCCASRWRVGRRKGRGGGDVEGPGRERGRWRWRRRRSRGGSGSGRSSTRASPSPSTSPTPPTPPTSRVPPPLPRLSPLSFPHPLPSCAPRCPDFGVEWVQFARLRFRLASLILRLQLISCTTRESFVRSKFFVPVLLLSSLDALCACYIHIGRRGVSCGSPTVAPIASLKTLKSFRKEFVGIELDLELSSDGDDFGELPAPHSVLGFQRCIPGDIAL